MNVLITGGTGLIGSNFIKRFPQYHYWIVSRDITKATQKLGGHHSYYPSVEAIKNIDDIDIIINLCGEPIAKRWTQAHKTKLRASRLNTTAAIAKLLKNSQSKKRAVISASAIGYYGAHGLEMLAEDGSVTSDFAQTLCRDWEQTAQAMQSELTRVCIIRIGLVLASYGGMLKKMSPSFKLGLGSTIASGQQGMSWIHINDLVEMIQWLIQHDTLDGPFNATAPNPVSNREFSHTLAKRLNRSVRFNTPALALKLLLGEMSTLLIDGQYVIPQKALDNGYAFAYPTLAKALEHLQI